MLHGSDGSRGRVDVLVPDVLLGRRLNLGSGFSPSIDIEEHGLAVAFNDCMAWSLSKDFVTLGMFCLFIGVL